MYVTVFLRNREDTDNRPVVLNGEKMVAKCSNPSCSAPYRYLRDGKLFRLESNPTLPQSKSDRVEYFWLCPACSSTMTLHLREDGTVVRVPLPEPIPKGPDEAALAWADRGKRLWLRSITSILPDHYRNALRIRLNEKTHAAAAGAM